MRAASSASDTTLVRPSLGSALGLTATTDEEVIEARTARLGEAATLWPMALAALLLVPLLLGGFAASARDVALAWHIA
ncbi:hypothetical protein, partial [Sphingomonas bacterium]|uniref:hypothetical protein n=1 Tax=Sphingomonas bacterium TaxID=1895847 RepID=UPI001576424D